MFMDFLGLCGDQVVNQAAKMRFMTGGELGVPLTIRTLAGAGLRAGPQHSGSLEAWLMHTAGLKVVMPSSPRDARGLLKAAIRDDDPVVVIENKVLYRMRGEVPEDEDVIPLGRSHVLRPGKDLVIVAIGQMVGRAMEAAERLSKEHHVQATVIDPRTLAPLDLEPIVSGVRETGHIMVVHEAQGPCGFGAELGMLIQEQAFDWLDAPVVRVTPPVTPVPFSPSLEDAYLPSVDAIVTAALRLRRGLTPRDD
jgi:pyruvate dehydrogenase E1 component beta subunit